jgi:hypothetical protein
LSDQLPAFRRKCDGTPVNFKLLASSVYKLPPCSMASDDTLSWPGLGHLNLTSRNKASGPLCRRRPQQALRLHPSNNPFIH